MERSILLSMKNKILIAILIILVLIVLVVVVESHPAKAPTIHEQTSTLPDAGTLLSNATYSFYGDTFTLKNGATTIQGHAFATSSSSTTLPLIPMGYNLAATSTGTVGPSGQPGAVAAVYRGFGANLEWTTLFLFTQNINGTIQQAASGVAYQGNAKVQSVSLDNGTITLSLLVVSPADMQKPHYEQTPTAPLILHFVVLGNRIIPIAGATGA